MNSSIIRKVYSKILLLVLSTTTVSADEVADYLSQNPDVSVYNLLVGTGKDTCDPDCATYESVDLSVPDYVLNNIIEEFPAARNGVGDISITSISYDDELLTLEGDDTSAFPFYDGDTVTVLYKVVEPSDELLAVGREDSSTSVATQISTASTYENGPSTKMQKEDRQKPIDRRQLQILKIQENLPNLDPDTIMIAINILKNEFQSSVGDNYESLRTNISEKVDLIDSLVASGELSDYNLSQQYPRLKFFSELNTNNQNDLTEAETLFLKQVNEDLVNLSSSIMRRNPEVLVKGLYRKLLKDIKKNNAASEISFLTKKNTDRTLSFSEHLFIADMMKSEFDKLFENLLGVNGSNYSLDEKYNPRIIDQEFLLEKLRLQEEVMLYLGLFKEEIFEDRQIMESFSDAVSYEMDLTAEKLEERFLAKKLIEELIAISENARLDQAEASASDGNSDIVFDDIIIVNQVNAILDNSVNDILNVINRKIDVEQSTFWENLREFFELPGAGREEEYINTQTAALSKDLDLGSFQSVDEVLSKRQEIMDLAATAAVMGFAVLGPP